MPRSSGFLAPTIRQIRRPMVKRIIGEHVGLAAKGAACPMICGRFTQRGRLHKSGGRLGRGTTVKVLVPKCVKSSCLAVPIKEGLG